MLIYQWFYNDNWWVRIPPSPPQRKASQSVEIARFFLFINASRDFDNFIFDSQISFSSALLARFKLQFANKNANKIAGLCTGLCIDIGVESTDGLIPFLLVLFG